MTHATWSYPTSIRSGAGRIAYWAHLGGFFLGAGSAYFLIKQGFVEMERWECSLIDMQQGKHKQY